MATDIQHANRFNETSPALMGGGGRAKDGEVVQKNQSVIAMMLVLTSILAHQAF